MRADSGVCGHIFVVDDDAGVRDALDSLFRSDGYQVTLFSDPYDFLAYSIPENPSCLLLDVKLGNVSGLDIQEETARTHPGIPVIMMTGHGNMLMAVRGMKAGAVDFLAKPFSDAAVLRAVSDALQLFIRNKKERQVHEKIKKNYLSLSEREKEVMSLIVSGLMNKQIAGYLSLSIVSIKVYRSHVMKKMMAGSLADLVRQGELLGIRDPSITRYQISSEN